LSHHFLQNVYTKVPFNNYAKLHLQVLPTQLVPDDEGKYLRVRLIQKEGSKYYNPTYLFDEGSTISWIPCGRKLTCSFPGIKMFYGPDTYFVSLQCHKSLLQIAPRTQKKRVLAQNLIDYEGEEAGNLLQFVFNATVFQSSEDDTLTSRLGQQKLWSCLRNSFQ
jgi:hypothetical protein